jgi:acyl-CoA synthetase (NDP forming)
MAALDRLLRPRSIAVIGGGAWCESVIRECRRIGFAGAIWPVHPTRETVGGLSAHRSVDALPEGPDAAFVGVNRAASIEVVAALSARGAGGAVCFASGFREARAEMPDGPALEERLVAAAGTMPILGPNCYGFVNALDRAALWPDVHGMVPCEAGVALVGQSSNVAINLTMQRRGLPLAYVATVGNQAQTGMADIGAALLSDPRVTALGLHIEGVSNLRAFEALARTAARLGKPVVVLKTGASPEAQLGTVSHTASLAGSDAGARALMARLGFATVESPAALIETLKILHVTGGLASATVASLSCSGGEASLMADLGQAAGVRYPPLDAPQAGALRAALGPRVALANPLDYHTYIWGDEAALTRCFCAMMTGTAALGVVVLDFPRPDRFDAPDWHLVVTATAEARRVSGRPMAILSSLPEGMPESVACEILGRGLIPLCGMSEGLAAIAAAAHVTRTEAAPLLLPNRATTAGTVWTEAEAKARLAAHGLRVPRARAVQGTAAAVAAARDLGFPVVLKGAGLAHKTEAGAVALDLGDAEALERAARAMPADAFLVEEMIRGAVAEILVGVLNDPAHGFVLTLGAGGVLTEIMADTTTLLLPVTRDDILAALARLRIAPLLAGYRGRAGADIEAVVAAVLAVQDFVTVHRARVQEVEINPLLCGANFAIAADALIRMGDPE